MLKSYFLIYVIVILNILLGEIKSLENPVLRFLVDKIDINNSYVSKYIRAKFIEKAINSTNLNISSENLKEFLKGSKYPNNTNFEDIPTPDINNITAKFNCFFFNSDDFSVFDLSHLDKEE